MYETMDHNRKCLAWLGSFPNGVTGHEDEAELVMLTDPVRKSYVLYLQKMLMNNFEISGLTKKLNKNRIKQLIEQLTLEIELEALVNSSPVLFYQRNMSNFIQNVKRCTEQLKVYEPSKKFKFLDDERQTCDHNTQTEDLQSIQEGIFHSTGISKSNENNKESVNDPIEVSQLFQEFLMNQNSFNDIPWNSMISIDSDQSMDQLNQPGIDNAMLCNNPTMLESNQFFQNNMINGQDQFMGFDQNMYNSIGNEQCVNGYHSTMTMNSQPMIDQNLFDFQPSVDTGSIRDQFNQMNYEVDQNGFNQIYGGLTTGVVGNDDGGMKNDEIQNLDIDPQLDMLPDDLFDSISVDESFMNELRNVIQDSDFMLDENLPPLPEEKEKLKAKDEKMSLDKRLKLIFDGENNEPMTEDHKLESKKECHRRLLKLNDPDYVELLAISYNFKTEMKQAPKHFQDKLTKMYNNLFGHDHNVSYASFPDSYLSLACHKRTAKMVVFYLTKYLNEGKITSKAIFKRMAKYVTCRILDNNLIPDIPTVKKSVDEFFPFNRVIRKDSDYIIST